MQIWTERKITDPLAEPIIDALMRALAHVLLGLLCGSEGAGGGYRMNAGIEVDVAFPYPGVSGRV